MNTALAPATADARSDENFSRPPLTLLETRSARPGSKIGISPPFSWAILSVSLSTHVTSTPNSEKQAAETSPTYPAPIIAMRMTELPSRGQGWPYPNRSRELGQHLAYPGAHVAALQRVRQVRLQITDLGAAVEASPVKSITVERHETDRLGHRVRQLDFVTSTALLMLENGQDDWFKNVPADDRQSGGRVGGRRFF